MNIFIFIIQTILIVSGCLVALRMGKEALITFVALLCVLSNFFVLKQITIFGFHTTAAEPFSVGAILGLHLLQEYWGSKTTKMGIWICFFSMFSYTILSQIHLLYIPSNFDIYSINFCNLLQFAPRLTFVSLFVYFSVQNIDRYFYGKLLKRFGHSHLLLRNYALLFFTQLIDTSLFAVLGLYGIVHSILQIIIVSFLVKSIAILIATPFLSLSKKLIRPSSLKSL